MNRRKNQYFHYKKSYYILEIESANISGRKCKRGACGSCKEEDGGI
ncbi:hypothetical protein PAE4_20242 [Bacillus altitudinis]|nr:hypothetical protein PAE4_20242 [Bacillus altitudinis]